MVLLVGLLLLASTAWAATTCNTDLTLYPYCISIPDNTPSDTLLPTVLFLSGRGARGSPGDVASLSTYDGFGKLVSQANGGSTDEAAVLAATKFVVIVPVAPLYMNEADPQYWYPERLMDVLNAVKKTSAPIDWDRFHCAGYSMGAFGTWRFSTAHPDMCASIVTSGGNAETNTITNTLGQSATPPAQLLSGIIKEKIPVRAFTGTGDTTIPMSWLEQTQDSMEKEGAGSESKLTILNTDHSGLSTIPFDASLLNWMLQQKRSGATGSDNPQPTTTKAPKPTSTKPTGKGKGKGTKKGHNKTKSSPAAAPTSNQGGKKKCTPAQRARRLAKRQAEDALQRHIGVAYRRSGL